MVLEAVKQHAETQFCDCNESSDNSSFRAQHVSFAVLYPAFFSWKVHSQVSCQEGSFNPEHTKLKIKTNSSVWNRTSLWDNDMQTVCQKPDYDLAKIKKGQLLCFAHWPTFHTLGFATSAACT